MKNFIEKYGFWLAGLVVVNALIRDGEKTNTLNNAPDDADAQLAIAFKQAFNPSGFGWLEGSDGTDEKAVLELAARSVGRFPAIAQKYSLLYGENLTNVVTRELSATELQKFWAVVNGQSVTGVPNAPAPTTPAPQSSTGRKVYATKPYNVRKSTAPFQVAFVAKVGAYLGEYAGEKVIPINGVNTAVVVARVSAQVPLPPFGWPTITQTTDFLIAKNGVRIA